jgi:transposase
MTYSAGAVERAMTIHQALLHALHGRQTWLQVADVIGLSPRSVRRWRARLEQFGVPGLLDRRRRTPSPRRVPLVELQRILRLYRERYQGFNVRHFHQLARREHAVTFSYTLVKTARQAAGLVPKGRARGRHRRRREPWPCFGELLHLDGSRHRWLTLAPAAWHPLLVVVDDATKQILYAQLIEGGESTHAIMTALWAVCAQYGVPGALYPDRAHWAVHTPTAHGAPDRTRLTQVGRPLQALGIEHILGYSPQARGRSERANRTLQDRLVNELRLAGVRTFAAANHYLVARFLPTYNATFGRPAADPASAFVPVTPAQLEPILCHEEPRIVARDNTVALERVVLQIAKQRGRRTLCRAACARPAPSRWPAFRLVGAPRPGPLRCRRPAPDPATHHRLGLTGC